jgi:hypothetical protein
MQSLYQHFLLRGKTVMSGLPDVIIDFFQAVFAQTVKMGLSQKSPGLVAQFYLGALAMSNVPHLTGKGDIAFGTVFFFVFTHLP